MNFIQTAAIIAALIAAAPFACAQNAGTWSASIGSTQITPSVTSGNLTAPSPPNTKIAINSDRQFTGALDYMVTDHFALHLPIGFGYHYDIDGAGSIAGVGVVADTKVLPITLLAQYRYFESNARFRPYLGAGLTYVKFFHTNGSALMNALTNPGGPPTGVSFQSKLAPMIQLGAIYYLSERWYLDASYSKTFLKTRGTLTTGQTIDVRLNPDTFCLQVGYTF